MASDKGIPLKTDSKQKKIDRRTDSRNSYSGPVFFATKRQLFEGELKNFSRHGLFIKTFEILALGEFITVALPCKDARQNKLRGQILWRNLEGYGVELVRKRNGTNFKLLNLKTKSG